MGGLIFLEGSAINRNGSLRDLLAIDGPDFTNKWQSIFKEGLIAQGLVLQEPGCSIRILGWGDIRVELAGGVADELRSTLDRLSSSIDAACHGWAGLRRIAVISLH